MDKRKHKFLTTATIPCVIGRMAVPTIVSMMLTSLYNIANTYTSRSVNSRRKNRKNINSCRINRNMLNRCYA